MNLVESQRIMGFLMVLLFHRLVEELISYVVCLKTSADVWNAIKEALALSTDERECSFKIIICYIE